MQFLRDDELAAFRAYAAGRLRKGASTAANSCGRICARYTPSLQLLGYESRSCSQRHQGYRRVKELHAAGKCKPVAPTHERAQLMYSQRNMLLATSCCTRHSWTRSRRAAVLLSTGKNFPDRGRSLTYGPQYARPPCPVIIDFGDVSMAMRDLLRRIGRRRFATAKAVAIDADERHESRAREARAQAGGDWGYRLQRVAHRHARGCRHGAAPPAPRSSTGHPDQAAGRRVVHFVNRKCRGGLPKREPHARCASRMRASCRSSANP